MSGRAGGTTRRVGRSTLAGRWGRAGGTTSRSETTNRSRATVRSGRPFPAGTPWRPPGGTERVEQPAGLAPQPSRGVGAERMGRPPGAATQPSWGGGADRVGQSAGAATQPSLGDLAERGGQPERAAAAHSRPDGAQPRRRAAAVAGGARHSTLNRKRTTALGLGRGRRTTRRSGDTRGWAEKRRLTTAAILEQLAGHRRPVNNCGAASRGGPAAGSGIARTPGGSSSTRASAVGPAFRRAPTSPPCIALSPPQKVGGPWPRRRCTLLRQCWRRLWQRGVQRQRRRPHRASAQRPRRGGKPRGARWTRHDKRRRWQAPSHGRPR